MGYRYRKKYRCYFCGRHTRDIVSVLFDNEVRILCIRCFLSYTLHETIKDMLRYGNEEDLISVVRVLEGINDLVEDNPFVQAIRYVIDEWAQKYPQPLYVDQLEARWRYRFPLVKILKYLQDEEIFVMASFPGSKRVVISPGDLLRSLLKRYSSSRDFFRDIVKAITGLAVVRYLIDPQSLKLRMVYATLQAIAACIERGTNQVYYKIMGYKCKLCNGVFSTKSEIKMHLLREHSYEISCSDIDECFHDYVIEIKGKPIGILCRSTLFIEKASVYGVGNISKYLRNLLTRGAIIPQEGDEIIREEDGVKYVVIDPAWIKVRERMRMLERQLIRPR